MLTDTAIKALKAQKKLYKVSDRDGMYVVVQPSGAIVFRYDYRLNGRRETLTLGLGQGLLRHVAEIDRPAGFLKRGLSLLASRAMRKPEHGDALCRKP